MLLLFAYHMSLPKIDPFAPKLPRRLAAPNKSPEPRREFPKIGVPVPYFGVLRKRIPVFRALF